MNDNLIYLIIFLIIFLAPIAYYKLKARRDKKKEETKNQLTVTANKVPITSSVYIVDDKDNKLFYHINNRDIRIRISKIIKSNFDELTLSTSYPHNFQELHVKDLVKSIPQVASCFTVSSAPHKLIIYKSPAASFDDIQDKLLRFVFRHLEIEWAAEETNGQLSLAE